MVAMNEAVRHVFRGNRWPESFTGNGFGRKQKSVRASIWAHLGLETPTDVPPTLPSLQQFSHIWPQRSDVPIGALFAAFAPQHNRPPHAEAQRPQPDHDSQNDSWVSRLRPRLNRAASSQLSSQLDPDPLPVSSSTSWPAPPPPAPVSLSPPAPPAARARARLRPRPIPPCRR